MVRGWLSRHGWDKVTYQELLEGPLGKMVSCLIAIAVFERATRITPERLECIEQNDAKVWWRHWKV
jgi:hypothetical protein